jgi:hypothetical protein
MIKSLYLTCIPNDTYLKINLGNLKKKFIHLIYKKYNNFIVKNFYNSKYSLISVKIIDKKTFFCNKNILYSRKDFRVSVNVREKEIVCFVEENIYSFDSMLRIIFGTILFNKKGLLLHSCGIVYDKKGFLFIGNSGRGKSTLIKNSFLEEIKVLSDELVAVIYKKGKFFTYKSPFFGDIEFFNKKLNVIKSDNFFEIKKIFVLNRHTKKFLVKKIFFDESIKKLLKNNLCLFKKPVFGNKILTTAIKIVKNIDFFNLNFSKDFVITPTFLEDLNETKTKLSV